MNKLPPKIRKTLNEFRVSQEKQILHYQSENNNEMVYLVRWSILEKAVKTITTEYRREILIKSLQNWLSYAKKGTNKPTTTPKTAIELKTLPLKKEFINALNFYGINGNSLWSVMDSGGRHRRHRNELAHTGKKFINYLLYETLCSGMIKITNKVYDKIS